jgi:hypothetical protein
MESAGLVGWMIWELDWPFASTVLLCCWLSGRPVVTQPVLCSPTHLLCDYSRTNGDCLCFASRHRLLCEYTGDYFLMINCWNCAEGLRTGGLQQIILLLPIFYYPKWDVCSDTRSGQFLRMKHDEDFSQKWKDKQIILAAVRRWNNNDCHGWIF